MKTATLLLTIFLLFTSTLAFRGLKDDTDNLQQIYNGVFGQAGLPAPTTVLSCYDTASATLTVNSIGSMLQQVSAKNFFGAIKTMKDYYHQAPASITTCLQHNDEFVQFVHAYNAHTYSCLQLLARVAQYSVTHSQQLVSLASVANDDFTSGNYTGVGQQLGVIAQTAIGTGALAQEDSSNDEDNMENLQQIYNGLFTQVGLNAPNTILNCYDNASATLTVNSIGSMLQQVSAKNFFGAIKTMKDYYHQAPASITTCLQHNDEFVQFVHAYNAHNYSCLQLLARVAQFSVTHAQQLVSLASVANDDFTSGNYTGVGQELGVIAQTAIGTGALAQGFLRLGF